MESKKRKFWTPKPKKRNEVTQLKDRLSENVISNELSLDEVAMIIVAKHGLQTVLLLHAACDHVPSGFPNRTEYIQQILFDKGISKEDLSVYVNKHPTTSTFVVPSSTFSAQLHKASEHFKVPMHCFILPNLDSCSFCSGCLYGEKPGHITVFTLQGPLPGLKSVLKCRKCNARYNLDMYHEVSGPKLYYPDSGNLVSASNRVLFTRGLFEFMCESGNHAFVSAQAFAEIYNTVFGSVISALSSDAAYNIFPGNEQSDNSQCLLMTRKNTTEAFFNGEVESEIRERRLIEETHFDEEVTRETIMQRIDAWRREELYPHLPSECSPLCKEKGCENLRIVDGCWKLCFPHCMMAIPMEVNGYPLLNFPNVCTSEPAPNAVFCQEHLKILSKYKIPTEKKEFLEHIGCKGNPSTMEDVKKVDERVVAFMHDLLCKDECIRSTGKDAITLQGTKPLVERFNKNVLNSRDGASQSCNKDTGEKSRLRQRSRGHFVSVTGGGHILQFNPLFKSESPSQAFMLIVQMMYSELKSLSKPEQERRLEKYILCYDNICNVDALAAAKEKLPLPEPLDDLWTKAKKVIDRLHIKNHKDKRCHEIYSPDSLPESYIRWQGNRLLPGCLDLRR
uniref:Uncharacterized protein LOC111119663 n=1 Tax=Crassostrea virginica TaxID=6565 RepID=A0A8B8CIX5_CRAVI|nr:uncharacterized protein LOC111119663 [Crassostrea virginica]XP_022315778.1 uncharacterized protein LOC111119663 [Crassostrea virginica]